MGKWFWLNRGYFMRRFGDKKGFKLYKDVWLWLSFGRKEVKLSEKDLCSYEDIRKLDLEVRDMKNQLDRKEKEITASLTSEIEESEREEEKIKDEIASLTTRIDNLSIEKSSDSSQSSSSVGRTLRRTFSFFLPKGKSPEESIREAEAQMQRKTREYEDVVTTLNRRKRLLKALGEGRFSDFEDLDEIKKRLDLAKKELGETVANFKAECDEIKKMESLSDKRILEELFGDLKITASLRPWKSNTKFVHISIEGDATYWEEGMNWVLVGGFSKAMGDASSGGCKEIAKSDVNYNFAHSAVFYEGFFPPQKLAAVERRLEELGIEFEKDESLFEAEKPNVVVEEAPGPKYAKKTSTKRLASPRKNSKD